MGLKKNDEWRVSLSEQKKIAAHIIVDFKHKHDAKTGKRGNKNV